MTYKCSLLRNRNGFRSTKISFLLQSRLDATHCLTHQIDNKIVPQNSFAIPLPSLMVIELSRMRNAVLQSNHQAQAEELREKSKMDMFLSK
jgi:hypothetical protein